MTLKLEPAQFIEFLCGQTRPARFQVGGVFWVFRYPRGTANELRLASEFVGYRIASLLDVPVPEFCLAQTGCAFSPSGSSLVIPAGLGTATRSIENVHYPDLERESLPTFWETEPYLVKAAAVRVADTWMMNYDRRKVGNVAVRMNQVCPEVYFLDFDQAFLGKETAPGSGRPHWIESQFKAYMLQDGELLSGFDGSGNVKSAAVQRAFHFLPSVQRLRSITNEELEFVIQEIPTEWGITTEDRRVWVKTLLERRRVVLRILAQYGLT
jgi:hypothetical protein